MPENTTQLRVQDVMTANYTKADVKDSISSLMAAMKKNNAETALIFDGKKFMGIVSHSGLLRNVDLQKTKVSTIMKTSPKLSVNQSFDEIVKLMRNADTHLLPVIEKNQVIGAVNAQSILARMQNNEAIQRMTATQMATAQPIIANENDDLGKVMRQLKESNVRKVPVLNAKGIVSGVLKMDSIALDVLLPMDRAAGNTYQSKNSTKGTSKNNMVSIPVKSVMDENPIIVRGNEKGNKVVEMLSKQVNPLLIIAENGKHGMISVQNVFNAYLNQSQESSDAEENFIHTTHLPDVDEIDKAKIDSMLTKTFTRVQRGMKGEVHMHIVFKQSNKAGLRAKTLVSIRVEGAGKPYSSRAEDWKVLLATKEACSALESEISKIHHGRDESGKRSR